jgi:hypothetical protein
MNRRVKPTLGRALRAAVVVCGVALCARWPADFGARAREPKQARTPTPKLVSIFPMGVQQGKTMEVEVRGTGLTGTIAVWLGAGSRQGDPKSPSISRANPIDTKGPDGISAHVKAIPNDSTAIVRLVIARDARVGFHTLGLIGPGGLSGNLSFWVGPHEVIQGTGAPHDTPETAQPVKLPVGINGRISKSGQLDYYVFDVAGRQTVAFEVIGLHGADFDPQLALHQAGGSFLDPKRSRRLVFHEEIAQGGMPASRRMTYSFTKPGRYLVNLGNPFARGGADSSYLLRIAPVDGQAAPEDAVSWANRRLTKLRSRSVETPAGNVELVREVEPNDKPEQAQLFKVPAVLEGTIGRPGDIDRFRFRVKGGQKLAFEVQTPRAAPPHFNPRLDVLDVRGAVVLSNLRIQEGKIGTRDAKVIQVTPDLVGKLEAEGEYTLRVRDLTSVHGSPDHVYRVLVRPQIPHIGDIRLTPDGPVNLVPGAGQRLTMSAPGKEGCAGTLALSVEDLPHGVRAFVSGTGSTIDLVADARARFTPMPQVVRISGLPLAGEKAGSPFPVAAIPVMVLKR